MISRGTDISKYFREPFGLRDNESRLYLLFLHENVLRLFHWALRNFRWSFETAPKRLGIERGKLSLTAVV